MTNLFIVFLLWLLFVLFIFIFLLVNHKKPDNRQRLTRSFPQLITTANEQEYNPDINTFNWDLHKIRLKKFGRSQFKGLTFFISSEDRFYYLSEKGDRVYC